MQQPPLLHTLQPVLYRDLAQVLRLQAMPLMNAARGSRSDDFASSTPPTSTVLEASFSNAAHACTFDKTHVTPCHPKNKPLIRPRERKQQ